MRERVIMHIDMNAFYASVAQHLDPKIRNKPVAVAGDPERRNGIILAKSREAKACGVKTAEAIWQARQKCPDLIVVPPDYSAYKRYSTLARMICYEYTNQVEPFGLDESWIDVTGSLSLFGGSPMLIAREISERVKGELGLAVSVGVSWNKVFAKLGSDPDPVTASSRSRGTTSRKSHGRCRRPRWCTSAPRPPESSGRRDTRRSGTWRTPGTTSSTGGSAR